MAQDECYTGSRPRHPGVAAGSQVQLRSRRVKTYLLFIVISICAVLTFALFQHLLVLGIPLQDIRPSLLIVPAIVGAIFGYLLGKVRILHQCSRHQLELITQHDELLEQEISVRKAVEESLRDKHQRLQMANRELKAFSYSVSHDLRSPLRRISGFSDALAQDCGESLDDTARHYLERIQKACQRMEEMIDSLLVLSRVSSADVVRVEVNLSELATEILAELAGQEPERRVAVEVGPDLVVNGDRRLLVVVMENLLGNAWKFTARTGAAMISFRGVSLQGRSVFCVEDNGAGFNPEFAKSLFTPFQRMHQQEDFPGNGIGLATVQRALARMGGEIWAEGREGQGAKFCFSL